MFLYGASGHAKVIIDILKSNGLEINGIFDDNVKITELLDYSVLGLYSPSIVKDGQIIISIGDNELRAKVALKVSSEYGIAIHRFAHVSDYAFVDKGTVVMQNAVIQSNSKIGKHVIINTAAIVEHDCVVEDFVHISPNVTLCGNVKVGVGTHVGAGAIIIPGIKVGTWSVIGAGCVVVDDVPPDVIIVGNPGRIIKKR